jgi:hypothetical protein
MDVCGYTEYDSYESLFDFIFWLNSLRYCDEIVTHYLNKDHMIIPIV